MDGRRPSISISESASWNTDFRSASRLGIMTFGLLAFVAGLIALILEDIA